MKVRNEGGYGNNNGGSSGEKKRWNMKMKYKNEI